jgi:hypothetical protein
MEDGAMLVSMPISQADHLPNRFDAQTTYPGRSGDLKGLLQVPVPPRFGSLNITFDLDPSEVMKM